MIDNRIYNALSSTNYDVFQLIAAQDAELPLVAFGVETEPVQTKDGICGYTSTLLVYCANESISGAVEMGNTIIPALQLTDEIEQIIFKNRKTETEQEDGKEPIYVETLQFNIKHIIP